jgi:hypothetical protein
MKADRRRVKHEGTKTRRTDDGWDNGNHGTDDDGLITNGMEIGKRETGEEAEVGFRTLSLIKLVFMATLLKT